MKQILEVLGGSFFYVLELIRFYFLTVGLFN